MFSGIILGGATENSIVANGQKQFFSVGAGTENDVLGPGPLLKFFQEVFRGRKIFIK